MADVKRITKEQEAYYLKHDGLRCPFCKSGDITCYEWDGGTYSCLVKCSKCGREWRDCYKLVGITEA